MFETDDTLIVAGFEFDEANLTHLARHGLDANVAWEVSTDAPVYALNSQDHPATHLMIGMDSTERFWTIAIMLADDEQDWWRPITGWPSTSKEVGLWRTVN